ncbi:hypothetical protein ACA910_007829 [Epithemia clementina (nom. ined.)]
MGTLFSSPSASSSSSSWHATSRTVFITGASSGIGAELARNFARDGAKLGLLARNAERLEHVAAECRALGATSVHIYRADLTIHPEVVQATSQAVEDFGGFDVVVLNAGRSQGCYFEEIQDIEEIDYMMKLNVSGVIIPLQRLLPHIFKSSQSRIVFVGSVAGIIPVPYRSVYTASKYAVTGFCETLRIELKDTYGTQSPKVTLITIPEVSGTDLNEGRMKFGAEKPPIQFRNDTSLELEPTCQQMMTAIRQGRREWGAPRKVRLLRPFLSLIPEVLEGIIIRHIRRTHYRPQITSN